MEIDNKTRAAVLRELAENLRHHGFDDSVDLILSAINQLDPPQEPIHPHEGCEGMVVYSDDQKWVYTHLNDVRAEEIEILREATKLPAFLCDGTRPEWIKDGDFVWFIERGEINGPMFIDWHGRKYEYFCVIDPIQVQ